MYALSGVKFPIHAKPKKVTGTIKLVSGKPWQVVEDSAYKSLLEELRTELSLQQLCPAPQNRSNPIFKVGTVVDKRPQAKPWEFGGKEYKQDFAGKTILTDPPSADKIARILYNLGWIEGKGSFYSPNGIDITALAPRITGTVEGLVACAAPLTATAKKIREAAAKRELALRKAAVEKAEKAAALAAKNEPAIQKELDVLAASLLEDQDSKLKGIGLMVAAGIASTFGLIWYLTRR